MNFYDYVVTGGFGFIGTNLILALNRMGLDNILVVEDIQDHHMQRQEMLSYRDIVDWEEFNQWLCTINADESFYQYAGKIIHLGAESNTGATFSKCYAQNYRFTRNLAVFAACANIPMVYASSAATYGNDEQQIDEEGVLDLLKPLNAYGWSKHQLDLFLVNSKVFDFANIIGLKFFNVYGNHEEHKGSMKSMVSQLLRQAIVNAQMNIFEDGEQCRDFIHVDDVVDIILSFVHGVSGYVPRAGIYNVGTGDARSFKELCEIIEKMTIAAGYTAPSTKLIKMPTDVQHYYQKHTQANTTKLFDHIEKTGIPFPVNLEKGIERMFKDVDKLSDNAV